LIISKKKQSRLETALNEDVWRPESIAEEQVLDNKEDLGRKELTEF